MAPRQADSGGMRGNVPHATLQATRKCGNSPLPTVGTDPSAEPRESRMLAPVRSDPASLKRLAVVDGLRGIAILLVIGFHLWNLLPGLSGDRSTGSLDVHLAHLFRSGWIGVDLFFVISGFLLTGHLYDARGSSTYFRAFYVRRALRILPLYYAFLFFLLVVVPRIPGRLSEYLQIDMLRGVQSYYWTYTVNVAGCLRATAGRIPLAH